MGDRVGRGWGVERAGGGREGHDGAGTRDRGARCGLLVFLAHGPKQEERDFFFLFVWITEECEKKRREEKEEKGGEISAHEGR